MLEPEHCFVLDDGKGRAVGYCIGTADTKGFVRKYHDIFIEYLKTEGIHPPGPGEPFGWSENLPNALRFILHSPENLLHEEEPELLKSFPAHMHIDILPDYQKQGFGRKLIETLAESIKKDGAVGIHLLMAQANVDAGRFYERTGWKRYPKVLDGGVSGEKGVKDNTTWMVKCL
jgi:GNAT superfamily N-acetyltransferase